MAAVQVGKAQQGWWQRGLERRGTRESVRRVTAND